jgi:hypothetical protein
MIPIDVQQSRADAYRKISQMNHNYQKDKNHERPLWR